jgi:TolA-binding protein
MKNKLIITLSLVVGVALISMAAEPAGKKLTEADAVQELRTQITELRAKIQGLESQTKNLESTVEQLKQSQTRTPVPLNLFQSPASPTSIPSASSSHPPTVWGQGEVNGWTYYVVPCNQQSP